jgi:HSP20 family protein
MKLFKSKKNKNEKKSETEMEEDVFLKITNNEESSSVESELEPVGELSIDVYSEGDYLMIKSTVAGVKPDDIEVFVDADILTIRGKRQKDETISKDNYFFQECYWGSFERSLRLPITINRDSIEAKLKGGVLTIKLRKLKEEEKVSIKVQED